MKIRFYHWWIYSLFYRTWNPILRENKDMLDYFAECVNAWRRAQGKPADEVKP